MITKIVTVALKIVQMPHSSIILTDKYKCRKEA